MLIDKNQAELIKQNKICFIKKFVPLKKEYDFNFISDVLEQNHLTAFVCNTRENLKDIFQVRAVKNVMLEFQIIFDFLRKMFKYQPHEKDEIDLFFSLVSQVGSSHVDEEDVFILGLNGTTVYRVFDKDLSNVTNKDYIIEKGDIIYIPNGIKHKVISLSPRVIASIGFFGEKINGSS